jgi:acyl carrier protein
MTELEDRLQVMANTTFGVDIAAMQGDATFAEFGVDSLALIEFSIDMQREFNVPLEDGEVTSTFTIATTAELLESKGVAA